MILHDLLILHVGWSFEMVFFNRFYFLFLFAFFLATLNQAVGCFLNTEVPDKMSSCLLCRYQTCFGSLICVKSSLQQKIIDCIENSIYFSRRVLFLSCVLRVRTNIKPGYQFCTTRAEDREFFNWAYPFGRPKLVRSCWVALASGVHSICHQLMSAMSRRIAFKF